MISRAPLPALALAALALPFAAAAARAQILFSSDLDTSTGWVLAGETVPSSLATFGYDYSVMGIPASPNGGGTTTGLRMAANANGTIQALTASTVATFTSGQFKVTFDFWANTNGPLPGGGTGSTELQGGGVGYSGTTPRAGASLLVSGEGGLTQDYRMDKSASAQALGATGALYNPAFTSLNVNATTSANAANPFTAAFPGQSAPAAQSGTTGTALNGTVAFAWHTMTILADVNAGTASFWIDDLNIGTLTQAGTVVSIAGSGSLTILDSALSISNADLNADLVFAVFDNYKVEAVPEPSGITLLGLCTLPLLRRRRK